jgi:hypothetical protein
LRVKSTRDPEENRANVRAWRSANPDANLTSQREHYARYAEEYRARAAKYRDENPDLVARWRSIARDRHRESHTGHTPEYFIAQVRRQEMLCSVCERPLIPLYPSHVHADHDHKTGRPRGVLCQRCNTALGWLENELTERLLAYRADWSARHATETDVD